MAIYSTTLSEIVERTCSLVLHDWWSGTATGGSTSTIADTTARNEVDDYFNSLPYAEAYIRTTTDDNAPIGETRKISDFVQSTGTLSASDNFSAAVAANDTYSVHSRFKRSAVVEAINTAIDLVAEEALFWAIDESTITLTAGTYEYALPDTFMYLFKVSMADANGNFSDAIPYNQYQVIRSGSPELHLIRFPGEQQYEGHYYGELWADSDLTGSRALRLEGLVTPDRLSLDTDVTPIAPTYLMFQAGAMLWASVMNRKDLDPDDAAQLVNYWQGRADVERVKTVSFRLPPTAKRVRE